MYFTRRLRKRASLIAAAASNLANLAVSSPTRKKKTQKSPPLDSKANSVTPVKHENGNGEHQDAVITPSGTDKRKRKKQRALANTADGGDEIAEMRQELEAKKKAIEDLTAEKTLLCSELEIKHETLRSIRDDTAKLRNALTCIVCQELFSRPFTIECGHSLCYICLHSWLGQKRVCPFCRHRVLRRPIPSFAISDLVEGYIQLLPVDEKDPIKHRSEQQAHQLTSCSKSTSTQEDDLWDSIFPCEVGRGIIITDDGEQRCPFCAWEVIGRECINCGVTFGGSDDSGNSDSGDGRDDDDDDEDGDEDDGNSSEGNEYEFDSFMVPDDSLSDSEEINYDDEFDPSINVTSDEDGSEQQDGSMESEVASQDGSESSQYSKSSESSKSKSRESSESSKSKSSESSKSKSSESGESGESGESSKLSESHNEVSSSDEDGFRRKGKSSTVPETSRARNNKIKAISASSTSESNFDVESSSENSVQEASNAGFRQAELSNPDTGSSSNSTSLSNATSNDSDDSDAEVSSQRYTYKDILDVQVTIARNSMGSGSSSSSHKTESKSGAGGNHRRAKGRNRGQRRRDKKRDGGAGAR